MSLESSQEGIGDTGCETRPWADLPRLVQTRARVRALRGACHSLAPLIRVQFLKPHAGTPTTQEPAGTPNFIALDALSIIEVESQLAAVVKHLDRTLTTLERAIRVATHQQDSRIVWARTAPQGIAPEAKSTPTPPFPLDM